MCAYHIILTYICVYRHIKCPLADKQQSARPPSRDNTILEAMKIF